MTERWDANTYPLWHGFRPMSAILRAAGPAEMMARGDGMWVIDRSGRRFLDARAGIANMMLGYSRTDIVERMYRQALELPFVCTMRYDRPAPVIVEFAQALVDVAPANLRRVRFTHTGSAATEAALLMARQYQRNLGRPQKMSTIGLKGSYHGTSLMAMAASGQSGLHGLFAPMPEGFSHVASPNTDNCPLCAGKQSAGASCVDTMLDRVKELGADRVAAIIVEPVNAMNGVSLPKHYLRAVRDLCSQHDILLIFDEVFSGFGRMGPMFAYELSGVSPDIMCLSKGITAGYAPLGAVLTANNIYDAFDGPGRTFFVHGSSTDAHPISCAAGLGTISAYRADDVLARGGRMGQRLGSFLVKALARCSIVSAVRPTGSYIAIDMIAPDGRKGPMGLMHQVQLRCEEKGVLIDFTPDILMLVPPLVLDDAECDLLGETVASTLLELERRGVSGSATAEA
jgi:adenosylmethionine-8-amino-7-oxononanoate aminotransferase